jgi:hypothetical protein
VVSTLPERKTTGQDSPVTQCLHTVAGKLPRQRRGQHTGIYKSTQCRRRGQHISQIRIRLRSRKKYV